MTAAARRILTDLQSRLRRRYGDRLIELRLFGSRARGDARPDSDYDVLVLLRGPVDAEAELFRSSPDIAAVCLAHDAVLSCFFRSPEALNNPIDPFLEHAAREGVPLNTEPPDKPGTTVSLAHGPDPANRPPPR